MKKRISVLATVITSVLISACSSPRVGGVSTSSSDQDQNQVAQEQRDTDQASAEKSDASSTNGDPADASREQVEEFIDSQLESNAAGLEDYLVYAPFASAMTGLKCCEDEDYPLYFGGYLSDEPVLNCWISDPIVGDQRNYLFVVETEPSSSQNLSLEHMVRDDTRIEYTLEVGKTYKLLVYLQNNARSDLEDPAAGAVQDMKLSALVPLTVDSGVESRLSATASGKNTLHPTNTEVALTAQESAKLIWSDEVALYDMDGQYAASISFDQAEASYQAEDQFSATIDMPVADSYSPAATAFVAFEFSVAAK